MSYSSNRSPSGNDLSETLFDVIGGIAKFLLIVGLMAFAIGLGFLLYTIFATVNATPAMNQQAISNADILANILYAGVIAIGVGGAYLFWGEEILGPILLIIAGVLYASPFYLPSMAGQLSEAAKDAISSIQVSGEILGGIAIVVIVGDVIMRARDRAVMGAKKDLLKLGKDVKAERGVQNVFLGKCYQLPFCRKYVREKCPIYHAKRTCWREQVGCMCEEQIIMNALNNRVIPKDEVAAAAMIPRNNKLTSAQKFARCKSCVIYNEHQKHKYRASLPAIMVIYGLLYLALRGALAGTMTNLIQKATQAVHGLTLTGNSNQMLAPEWLAEFLVLAVFLILFSYTLKVIEWMYFSAKV